MTFYRLVFLIASCLLAAWTLLAPFFWIIRDGLGPDAEPSQGWEAVVRFLTTFHWGFVFVCLALTAGFAWSAGRCPGHGPR